MLLGLHRSSDAPEALRPRRAGGLLNPIPAQRLGKMALRSWRREI
jgi:hypothetical protein